MELNSPITSTVLEIAAFNISPPARFFRFLDMHPELRNIVYSFCEEKEVIDLSERQDNGPTVVGDFWGLMHVNKQIREEFKHIYLENIRVKVDMRKIVSFVNTFYPQGTSVPSTVPSTFPGLEIMFDIYKLPVTPDRSPILPGPVDLKPILEVAFRLPRIRYTVCPRLLNHPGGVYGPEERELQDFLDESCRQRAGSKWESSLQKIASIDFGIARTTSRDEPYMIMIIDEDVSIFDGLVEGESEKVYYSHLGLDLEPMEHVTSRIRVGGQFI